MQTKTRVSLDVFISPFDCTGKQNRIKLIQKQSASSDISFQHHLKRTSFKYLLNFVHTPACTHDCRHAPLMPRPAQSTRTPHQYIFVLNFVPFLTVLYSGAHRLYMRKPCTCTQYTYQSIFDRWRVNKKYTYQRHRMRMMNRIHWQEIEFVRSICSLYGTSWHS